MTTQIIKHNELNEIAKHKLSDTLSLLIKQDNEYHVMQDLYVKIINEYDNYCLAFYEKKIAEENETIQKAKIIIADSIQQIEVIEQDIVSKIDIKSDEIDTINKSQILLERIKIRKEFMQKEDDNITKIYRTITYLNSIVQEAKDQINDIQSKYNNRYITKIFNFQFSTILDNEIKDNFNLTNKAFVYLNTSGEKTLCSIYDRILYILSNSNIFIKSDERDLTAREWFVEVVGLTYFQFKVTYEYFKKNDFKEYNKLKEFINKAQEIKNITILLNI